MTKLTGRPVSLLIVDMMAGRLNTIHTYHLAPALQTMTMRTVSGMLSHSVYVSGTI